MMRHLAYVFPGQNSEEVRDRFLLGSEILVAPMLQRGAVSRSVIFPPGRWQAETGEIIEGPATREVTAPLSRLPWFRAIAG